MPAKAPSRQNELLEAARSYAARGWRVFPCHSMRAGHCSCGKKQCTDPGKHPRTPRGFQDASCDSAQITAWWSQWHDANVGIATGVPSNIVVIDVDCNPERDIDGEATLCMLESQYGALPEGVQQLTGGGGRQLFYQHPGVPIASSTGK